MEKNQGTTDKGDSPLLERVRKMVTTEDERVAVLFKSYLDFFKKTIEEEEGKEHPLVKKVREVVACKEGGVIKFLEATLQYVKQNQDVREEKKKDDQLTREFRKLVTAKKKKLVEFLNSVVHAHLNPRDSYEVRKGENGGCSFGTYMLEASWTFDNSHDEFLTFGLEKCCAPGAGFEEILQMNQGGRKDLLEILNNLVNALPVAGGKADKIRLYRIVGGVSNRAWPRDSHEVNLHFILKPICDFDDQGNPIPCKSR